MAKYTKQKLGDICRIEKGKTGIASAVPGEYPLVVTAEERKTCSEYQFDCEVVCIPLVSSSGHGKKSLKNVHYQSGKFALGSILCAVIPKNPQEVNACYLHQYLQFYKDTLLVPLMKGAANISLSMRDIANVEIPLPDFDTQAALAKIFVQAQKKQKELNAEFEKQTEYAKRLRQNILQEAIEGKLTAEWRKTHPFIKGNPDFDVQALFEQIQKEKKSDRKQKNLASITEGEMPFEIPDSWKWVRLGEIINESPKNGYSPKSVNFATSTKTLKLGAVTYGIFNPNEYKYINEIIQKDSCYWLKNGDILIERSNSPEYVGICAIYDGKDNEFIYPDLLMKFRVNELLSTKLIHKILISSFSRKYFMSKAKGAQKPMPKINQETVVNSMLPLSPLAEQKEILAKVESLLAKVTELEEQIQEHKKMTEKLIYSVIKEKLEM